MKLVVSKTCPYAQRAWITVKALQLDCDIEIIDLQKKPEWFLALTDFAKVPTLIDDEQRVLWESAVVSRYLNELQGYPLSPSDRFINATNEAWLDYVGQCQPFAFKMASSKANEKLQEFVQGYQKKFLLLENALGVGPYFNGEHFCLVDIFYAVIFVRADFAAKRHDVNLYENLPKVAAWSEALLKHPAVQETVVPDFEKLFFEKYFPTKAG